MVTTKSIKKGIIVALVCAFSFTSVALTQAQEAKSDMSKSPEVSTQKEAPKVPKGQQPIPVNFQGQPPLIPHSVEFYQVGKDKNDCLKCHDAEPGQKAGAKQMSASHYNKEQKLSMDHYVCVTCHIEQTDAKPIVDNKY